MTKPLFKLPTDVLMEKIGAGNHKPGSGSAAALNGILACKLILTVIHLTLEPKRKSKYLNTYGECNRIKSEIKDRIAPKLELLFQQDSDQFDKAINKRKDRDAEKNQKIKNLKDSEALVELKKSTELPLEIADLGVELANFSLYLFDNCFRSARGDSCVALTNGLSSITGCISIISLNLQSFPKNIWTERIKRKRKALRNEYDRLTKENYDRMDILEAEAERKNELHSEILKLKSRLSGKNKLRYIELESLAKDIQNVLWKFRDLIWKKKVPTHPIGVLNPAKVIKLLKYAYTEVDTLGVTELNDEIGGIIDNQNDTILISKMYPSEVKNFTSAHEMAHALLHDDLVLHRDKPLNRPNTSQTRPTKEKEADKLASYFLMPEKLVRQIFKQLFLTNNLIISDQTSFALANCSPYELRKQIKSKRAFSRLIAKSTFYNLTPFTPIHKIFNVSIEAMAIRLEELNLIEY